MQIQRIQTVYIFLAMVAMAIFLFVPYGTVTNIAGEAVEPEKLIILSEYGLLIPAALTAVLLLVDIFLYRNMALQRKVLVICLMLTVCCIAVIGFALFKEAKVEDMEVEFTFWNLLLVLAMVLELMALSAIGKDIKLLNSYNRLR